MSGNYEVTLTGVDELIDRLEAAGDNETLRDGMTAIGVSLSTNLKIYPPKPPRSTYDRTRTLRKKWAYQVSKDGGVLKLGNATPYAKWVQSDETQTWYHAMAGWQTAETLVEKKRSMITEILKVFIENALKGRK